MIRSAGIRIWEKENQQGPTGEHKMPLTPPCWNPNNERDRSEMNDYRNLIIKGIREAVPRGNNIKRAFCGQQGKDEAPMEWLGRLHRDMRQYSGTKPNSPAGQTLLEVHFATHAWPDIRRKLEKLEDWQEKDLDGLLREAQKVYVRRVEERMKAKAKIMRITMQRGHPSKEPSAGERRKGGSKGSGWSGLGKLARGVCYHCGQEGHYRRDCAQ